MDAPALFFADGTGFVDRIAQYVHDPAQGRFTDRHGDGSTSAVHVQATLEAFGGTHRNGTNHAVAQLLLDFQGGFNALNLQGFIDARHGIAREFHVDHGADDLNDTSATHVWFL